MIAAVVYMLCGLTSVLCAALLFRQHKQNRGPLLLWSAGGFAFLALSNILLFVDLIVLPGVDLSLWRHGLILAGLLMLIYGLIRGDH